MIHILYTKLAQIGAADVPQRRGPCSATMIFSHYPMLEMLLDKNF